MAKLTLEEIAELRKQLEHDLTLVERPKLVRRAAWILQLMNDGYPKDMVDFGNKKK